MRINGTSSILVLLLILFFCLNAANSALGEEGDSIFHYAKPDWWSEALWPNGVKYRYVDEDGSRQGNELYEEEPPFFSWDGGDSQVKAEVNRNIPRSPLVLTFPESVFGQLGPILFFGQSFLDYNPSVEFENEPMEHNGENPDYISNEKTITTDEDINKCQSLPSYDGNCYLMLDAENKGSYFAGYSIGFTTFASDSGKSRILKISFGVGISYIDITLNLSICTELGYRSGGENIEDSYCRDELKVDSSHLNGIFLMRIGSFTIYEYLGENFGFTFFSFEMGKVDSKTTFKDHDNLHFVTSTQGTDIFTVSLFF
jgi:hypothetical protein